MQADDYLPRPYTQPFYGSLHFVRDKPGEPVPEETLTHSHLPWSSVVPPADGSRFVLDGHTDASKTNLGPSGAPNTDEVG